MGDEFKKDPDPKRKWFSFSSFNNRSKKLNTNTEKLAQSSPSDDQQIKNMPTVIKHSSEPGNNAPSLEELKFDSAPLLTAFQYLNNVVSQFYCFNIELPNESDSELDVKNSSFFKNWSKPIHSDGSNVSKNNRYETAFQIRLQGRQQSDGATNADKTNTRTAGPYYPRPGNSVAGGPYFPHPGNLVAGGPYFPHPGNSVAGDPYFPEPVYSVAGDPYFPQPVYSVDGVPSYLLPVYPVYGAAYYYQQGNLRASVLTNQATGASESYEKELVNQAAVQGAIQAVPFYPPNFLRRVINRFYNSKPIDATQQ